MALQMSLRPSTLQAGRVRNVRSVPSTVRCSTSRICSPCLPPMSSTSDRRGCQAASFEQSAHSRARIIARASSSNNNGTLTLPDGSVSVVLLAGGVGKRMGASIPKQYLELKGQAIATYSLVTFAAMPAVSEIVIVCDPSWRYIFEEHFSKLPQHIEIKWALPGAERQDSVFSGLQQISSSSEIVAVHDSARPLVTAADAYQCMLDGFVVGAAVLGVPVKPTIKEVDSDMMVIKTLERSKLWEVQTPQCIRPDLLREGFRLVREKGLEVTDDVSIIEAMGLPVKITKGSYTNIKVTTPDDMSVAEKFLSEDSSSSEKQPAVVTAAAAAAVSEVQRTW
eukprot:GHUV01005401.1.p1 GENE.GHUV01005401.1~~GHUV01005401.1.p1  ORF type:complete len:356 (+),score=96.32 GHUV01005401.1:60-1070(+)